MSKSTAINLNNDCFVSVQVIENLYRTCVQNRVCKSNNEFCCYLCKFVTNELVIILKHIQHDKEHQKRNKIGEISTEMLNNLYIDEIEGVKIVLNGLIVINIQQFHCIICDDDLTSLKDVDNHIKGKRHKNCKEAKPVTSNANSSLCSSISSVNIFDSTAENVNTLANIKPVTVFNCNCCKIMLRSNAQYKYHQMFHLSPVRYSCCYIDIINFSLQEDKTRFMHCSICDKLLRTEDELENHLSDINHSKWVNFIQRTKVFALNGDLAIHLINLDIDCSMIIETPISFARFFYCQVCELSVPYSDNPEAFSIHENGRRHQKNLKSPSILDKNFESASISDNCVSVYVCFICNIEFSDENSLYIHYNEEIHQFCAKVLFALTDDKHLRILQTDKDTVMIQCTICTIETIDAQSMISHIFGSKHKKKIKSNVPLMSVKVDDENLDVNLESNQSLSTLSSDLKNQNYFNCPICEVNASCDLRFVEHLKSKKHVKKVFEYNATNRRTTSKSKLKLFVCHICGEDFFTDIDLIEHFQDIRHQNQVQAKCEDKNKFADSVIETVNINEYVSILKTDEGNVIIQCEICHIKTTDAGSMISHIYGPNSIHKKKFNKNVSLPSVKVVDKNLDINVESSESLSASSSDLKNKSLFYCPVCEVKVPRDFMLVQHLESIRHIKNVIKYNQCNHVISGQQLKLFSCQICEEHSFTDSELIKHFHDISHQNRVQTKNKLTNSVNENVEVSSASTFLSDDCNGIDHSGRDANDGDIANSILDKVVDFRKEENQENLSTLSLKENKRRRRPRKSVSSILSSENLSGIGEKYIELCIKSGTKNIYNLNANKMYKMRMGITFSVPTESDGRYCIPCNTEISSDLQTFCEHLRDAEHVKKISEIVANEKPCSTDVKDYFNDFRLACSYMRKSSENRVQCFACLMRIENLDTSSIFDHRNSKMHIDNCSSLVSSAEAVFQEITKTMQEAWYFAEKFICEICYVKCGSEINFAEHLLQDQHTEKVNQASVNGDVYEFDVCAVCATYWYGKPDYYASHCDESYHKNLLKSQCHVIPKLTDPVEHILNHCEDTIIGLFLHDSDGTDRNAEKALLKSLEMTMQNRYPKVKAHLFGSRFSGTSSDNNVLDIYLDCEDTYCSFTSAEQSKEQLLEVQKCLEEHEITWTIEEVLLFARIPIVKLRHRSTNRRCDIQCVNGLGVEKSKLIRFFVEACRTCRKLLLFLEKWLSLCRLSETQGITIYAISILVIFYLQTENILPSIWDLIKQNSQSNIVAGWEVGFFANNISIPKEKYTMKVYLSRFFDYYANFNYVTDVICPFLGRPVFKWDFVNFDKLPEEMNIFKSLYKSKKAEVFRYDSPMCVQDPIELSENVTKAVTKLQLRTFQHYCSESKTILDKV